MTRTIGVVGVLAAVFGLAAGSAHAYTWTTYNGHNYALTSYEVWTQAEADAEAAGGHLATVNDAAENAWLTQFIANSYTSGNPGDPNVNAAWTGYRQDTGGIWGWADGEAVTFTNYAGDWSAYTGTHAYLHGANHPRSPGMWNHNIGQDQISVPTSNFAGIIEVTPEPATLTLLAMGGLAVLARRRRAARQ